MTSRENITIIMKRVTEFMVFQFVCSHIANVDFKWKVFPARVVRWAVWILNIQHCIAFLINRNV